MAVRVSRKKLSMVLASSLSLLLLPAEAINTQQTFCNDEWEATVCADETWDASTFSEQASVFIGPNDFAGSLIANSAGDTVDIAVNSFTDAGSGAVVAILNFDTLAGNVPSDKLPGLLNVNSICQTGTTADCQAAVKAFFPTLSEDVIKNSSTWWHGCQHATDTQSKSFTGLSGPFGYAIGAETKGGSTASISAVITHHLNPPQTHTERICGAMQTGKLPAPGEYTNKVVGHVSLALAPQHGGTLPGKTVARGIFTVDSSGDIRFSGSISASNCPKTQPPQHIGIIPAPK